MQWLIANWQPVVLAVLAIDAALIPLFPKLTLLEKIKEFLGPIAPKQP